MRSGKKTMIDRFRGNKSKTETINSINYLCQSRLHGCNASITIKPDGTVSRSQLDHKDVEHNLEFASPVIFDQSISLGNQTSFIPMPIPTHPMELNLPALQSTGTIQTTDILVAKGGAMSLHVDSSGTHVLWSYTY